jgi:hypothetical protein
MMKVLAVLLVLSSAAMSIATSDVDAPVNYAPGGIFPAEDLTEVTELLKKNLHLVKNEEGEPEQGLK